MPSRPSRSRTTRAASYWPSRVSPSSRSLRTASSSTGLVIACAVPQETSPATYRAWAAAPPSAESVHSSRCGRAPEARRVRQRPSPSRSSYARYISRAAAWAVRPRSAAASGPAIAASRRSISRSTRPTGSEATEAIAASGRPAASACSRPSK